MYTVWIVSTSQVIWCHIMMCYVLGAAPGNREGKQNAFSGSGEGKRPLIAYSKSWVDLWSYWLNVLPKTLILLSLRFYFEKGSQWNILNTTYILVSISVTCGCIINHAQTQWLKLTVTIFYDSVSWAQLGWFSAPHYIWWDYLYKWSSWIPKWGCNVHLALCGLWKFSTGMGFLTAWCLASNMEG